MRQLLLAISILTIGFCACNKEETPLTKAQIKQRIDSVVAVRSRESDEAARIDLERRIKIEVKVKADSIANAMLTKPAAPAAAVPPPTPPANAMPHAPTGQH